MIDGVHFTVGVDDCLYAFVSPSRNREVRIAVEPRLVKGAVELLGHEGALEWRADDDAVVVWVPDVDRVTAENDPPFVLCLGQVAARLPIKEGQDE